MNREQREPREQMLFAEEVFRIQGAVFEVNREMGAGFLEAVYQERLEIEFAARRIPFVSMSMLRLSYKGQTLEHGYVPDFICFDRVIVELKAQSEIAPANRAQLINYLKASGLELGLLVNFGSSPKAQIEHIARSKH